MTSAKFVALMRRYKDRIICHYGDDEFDGDSKLLNTFNEFKELCDGDEAVKKVLEDNREAEPRKDFNEAWKDIPPRFLILRQFFGGFATLFANTASVESDFSIMKFEKSDYRQNLADISIGGIMHAKQMKEVIGMRLKK